jgi:hypothetical protein
MARPLGISTEWIFTHPMGFGVTAATALQRAICRAADGLPLLGLESHPDVISGFGGEAAVAALPVGRVPFEFYIVASTRSGKSVIASSIAIQRALTADVSRASAGDEIEVPIIATEKKKAEIIFKHLKDNLFSRALFKQMLVCDPTSEEITMRRPDGWIVKISVTAAKRAGGAAIGVWVPALVLDEAARMVGQGDGVVNFDETRDYAMSRILRGGSIVAVTSPWAPFGPIYEAVEAHFGKPSRDIVIVRGTGPQMNPKEWDAEKVADLKRRKPIMYKTDCLGEFADAEYSFFGSEEIDRATRQPPDGVAAEDEFAPQERGMDYGAAMDAATRSNAWTLVIAGKRYGKTDEESTYVLSRVRQWIPEEGAPLVSKDVFRAMKEELDVYGVTEVWSDQWCFDPMREHAEAAGITLLLDDRPVVSRKVGFEALRDKLESVPSRLELHPNKYVKRDLVGTRKKLTQEGMQISHIVTKDGRHCDFAPAIERAVNRGANQGVTWVRAMDAVRARGRGLFEPDAGPDASKPLFCWQCSRQYTGPCPRHGPFPKSVDPRQ